MRKSFLLVLTAALALPALALAEQAETRDPVAGVTVNGLEQTLTTAHGEPDAQLAQELSRLELTERLSALRRARLDAELPGPAARQALVMLAEASEFLNLPATEIPTTPAPDHAAQTHVLAMARDYVLKTILKLPNFFATRETASFEGSPAQSERGSSPTGKLEPLHPVSHSSVTVLYRDNRELVTRGKKQEVSSKQLRTMGEFGPILVTVLNDAARGTVTWSHWEQGPAGAMAVFRYVVPEQASHYQVSSTSVDRGTQHDPAYHGEMALNPANGSILRLTAVADLKVGDPMLSADLLVDYGPVEIGGVTYICPVRSVALSQVRMVIQELDFTTGATVSTSLGAPKNYLNEVLFKQYHLFRAETRILAGDGEEPGTPAPASSPK